MEWKPNYEKTDMEAASVVRFSIILFATIGVALAVVFIQLKTFRWAANHFAPAPSIFAGRHNPPPEPRLQVSEPVDLAVMRAHEDDVLTHYAWIDRDAGVVRLPIQRAMELVAKEGLPSRAASSAAVAERRPSR